MRDHIHALTKLTEDALRLIIPFPHFRGHHDFTTLVNEEIKKTTFREISADESNRIISGLRQMLYHYENEAELLSMDVLQHQPQIDSNRGAIASGNGTSPPDEPTKQYPIHKVSKAMNRLPDYQCPALNTALQDLITLREAAIEHARQRSCDFSLILKELGTAIDVTRRVHLDRLATFEKLEEAKALVDAKDYYMEKLLAKIESACPLLNASLAQNSDGHKKLSVTYQDLSLKDAKIQRDKLKLMSNENEELHLQRKDFGDRIKQLEAETLELHLQRRMLRLMF
jgi:hypothetical protein